MNAIVKPVMGVASILAFVASAQAVTISSYDVTNALPSGTGNWSHTYSGAIVDNNYSGGSGTLNDGIIPDGPVNNQLFSMEANSTVTLHLSDVSLVSSVELLGGVLPLNYIPGSLTGWSVTINGHTVALVSTGYTPGCYQLCNDSVSLLGTGLELLPTNTVTLSAFQGGWRGFYNIGEATVDAVPVPVPEPETYALMLGGLGVIGVIARRRKTA